MKDAWYLVDKQAKRYMWVSQGGRLTDEHESLAWLMNFRGGYLETMWHEEIIELIVRDGEWEKWDPYEYYLDPVDEEGE